LRHRRELIAGSNAENLFKINFSIPHAGEFAALSFPVGGATGVLYTRRSADGIFSGGRTESGLAQFANSRSRAPALERTAREAPASSDNLARLEPRNKDINPHCAKYKHHGTANTTGTSVCEITGHLLS